MNEPGRRYTATEKAPLERLGYEFRDATDIRDREPHYVVCDYRPPHLDDRPPRCVQDLGDCGP